MSSRENVRGESTPMSTQMGEALVMRLVTVERELQEVQRKNSLLLIALGAALALGLAGVALGLLAPGRGIGNAIVLHDVNGTERVVLRAAGESGEAGLVLKDKNGADRVRLMVLENDAPGIALLDSHARNRVTLGFFEDGVGTLTFADENGNTRAILSLTANNSAALLFTDGNQEARATLGVGEDGNPIWRFEQRGGGSQAGTEAPLTTGR